MQVTENSAKGLKREYSVVITAADMERRLDGKLQTLSQNIRMPGFRPGKVPPSLVKKIHGKSVMGEVLDEAVRESTEQLIKDKELRPAVQPKVEFKAYEEGADLSYDVAIELLPDISLPDFSKIKLERWIADIPEEKIQEVLDHLATQHKSFIDKDEGAKAETGDVVVIDFKGFVDGDAFEGGTATGHQLELGSHTFIPGFEDQLVGAAVGDHHEVKVTFPKNYTAEALSGKDAVFEVDVSGVKKPVPAKKDDELAKQLGMEDLEALTTAVREQAVREHDTVSRARLKRSLLDTLSETEQFDVPQTLLDMEFDQIWAQVEQDMARQDVDKESDPEALESMKSEYRAIANRRVRLGLLLAEVGRQNQIQVSQEELSRALSEEARRHPGQEREVYEHFQNHPEAMARLQAPLMEDKSVDFILELVTVTENKVPHDELMAPPDQDGEEPPTKKAKKADKAEKTTAVSKGKKVEKASKPAAPKKSETAKKKTAAKPKKPPVKKAAAATKPKPKARAGAAKKKSTKTESKS